MVDCQSRYGLIEASSSDAAVELKGTLVMQSYASLAGTMGVLTVAAAASFDTLAHAPSDEAVGYGAGAPVLVIMLVAVPIVVL